MCRGCREVVKSGWQVVRPWMGSFHEPIPARGYKITQSPAPDDGHMVARNMLRENKEYKNVTSSWFFLSTLNYDARSTTYQNVKLNCKLCHKQRFARLRHVSDRPIGFRHGNGCGTE